MLYLIYECFIIFAVNYNIRAWKRRVLAKIYSDPSTVQLKPKVLPDISEDICFLGVYR